MNAKEKANQLLKESTGANFSTAREKEVAQYWQAQNIIKEVVLALKSNFSTDKEMASNNTGTNNKYTSFEDTDTAKYWNDVLFHVENWRE